MIESLVFKKLLTVEEMLPNYPLICELTPSLTSAQYQQYLENMVPHQYFQVIATVKEKVIAVSGYWIATKIYSGKYLEIDNFIVTEPYRKEGVGQSMIRWMEEEARTNQCRVMMLDAYVENFKAHAFYYRQGFIARGFHYLKPLD
jgi:GNAT superfamily N-acetyltransferase